MIGHTVHDVLELSMQCTRTVAQMCFNHAKHVIVKTQIVHACPRQGPRIECPDLYAATPAPAS